MVYPQDIAQFLKHELLPVSLPESLNFTPTVPSEDMSLEQWMVSVGRNRSEAVASYLDYLGTLTERFRAIKQGMEYKNPKAKNSHGDDENAVGWAGEGMLPIALYAYYLASYGVRGDLLECGVFKGGSTCCLSLVGQLLGLKLWSADSFEGLPYEDHFYKRGEFFGSMEEVRGNVERLGAADHVTFIKGLFGDSLKGFKEPLSIIWIDADLKQSVLDVLENTYHNLVPGGVIFSDGLMPARDFKGDKLHPGSPESAAFVEFFQAHGIPHKAQWTGFGNLGLIVPGCPDSHHLIYQRRKVKAVLQHASHDWMSACLDAYDNLEQVIWRVDRICRDRQTTIERLEKLCREREQTIALLTHPGVLANA